MVDLTSIAVALGVTGLFASRVFLPMFAAAIMLRFGADSQLFGSLGLLEFISLETVPTWFTSDATLTVLGILAACELFAHKSPAAREVLSTVDQYGKPAAALLTYFGVIGSVDREFVDTALQQAGFSEYILPVAVVAGTYIVAAAHNTVLRTWIEVDEDDDSGVFRLFSWGQDLYSFFGVFFLILFPIVMLVLIGIVIGFILLLRKRAEIKEEKSKIACPNCGEPMYRSAMACPKCAAANPAPTDVNWLGASTMRSAVNKAQHPMRLVAKKRCRICATRLTQQTPDQTCPACAARPFDDPEFVAGYDRMISSRLGLVLLVCLLLSMIPIIGLVPGVIYYRMRLVAPYRRYMSRVRSFFLRWGIRILFFILIIFQWMPGVGAFVVPLMALISHSVYRGSFLGLVPRSAAVRTAALPA